MTELRFDHLRSVALTPTHLTITPYSIEVLQPVNISSVQTVTQSCPTLCDPMDCSTPGLPVHHQLLEFTQTHVHWVSDAIQPSHRLLSPSPLAFNLSQHQGLFFFFLFFLLLFFHLFLLVGGSLLYNIVVGFVIHWHESTMDLHVFPIPIPSPTSLSTQSLWVFPVPKALSNESVLGIRWPKYWSFSFNISPSNECSGLTAFRIDWLDLFAVQGTLLSLLQHHNSKASILQHSAFFIVQLSVHDHWKNHSFD